MINEVLDVMVELAREGMTMMVVTHEMGFARKVAHRVVFMDERRIVEDCSTDDFFGPPRSERAQAFLSRILQHRSGPARSLLVLGGPGSSFPSENIDEMTLSAETCGS